MGPGRITPGFLLDLGPSVAPHRGVLEDCEFPVNNVNGHMKRESSGYCRRLHSMSP